MQTTQNCYLKTKHTHKRHATVEYLLHYESIQSYSVLCFYIYISLYMSKQSRHIEYVGKATGDSQNRLNDYIQTNSTWEMRWCGSLNLHWSCWGLKCPESQWQIAQGSGKQTVNNGHQYASSINPTAFTVTQQCQAQRPMTGQTARPTAPPCCPQHIHLPNGEVQAARQKQTAGIAMKTEWERKGQWEGAEDCRTGRKEGIEMWRKRG